MKLPAILGLVVLGSLSLVTVNSAAYTAVPGEQKLTPIARDVVGRTPTSRLARTDRTLLGRTDSEPVPVIVKLDHDPVASYRGGVPGLEPTSPAATGRSLAGTSAEVAYEQYLEGREQRFTNALRKKLPMARVGHRLRTVYGGVALTVPANRIEDLLKLDGVVAVQKDELREPLTDSSTEFIGADHLTGGRFARNAGAGVIVGVLDTGAWPEHPSFADQGNLDAPPPRADGKPRKCDFGRDFKCNDKLIGGQAFLRSYLAVHPNETFRSARDSDGHGTHTASTAAGNVLDSAKVFGVERGPIRGVAPGAWISVYKVCGTLGCMSSDSAMAVAQAIRDGVDVINFSISGGVDPFTDPVEMAFLDAYAAGVFVAASAGNAGPGPSTVHHLSPWVTTVAASTQQREFGATLTLENGTRLRGVSITDGVGPATIVANGKCLEPAKPNTFTGKIVLCERGTNARVAKGWNVLKGGAIGMILYNPSLQDVETDNHWLPTIHLPDNRILSLLEGRTAAKATISAGAPSSGQGDVIAGFSSRGPGGLALKPDVTAPGVQILAGHSPVPDEVAGGPPGEMFQAIAGTSMSSPHVAGAAALLAARRPDWTPGEIKSALMTTAVTEVVKEDLTSAADPHDFGAGRIAVDKAARPGLTISESAARMVALAGDEVRAVDLNLPSVNMPVMPGRVTTTRTLRNDSDQPLMYRVETSNKSISVDHELVTIPPGGTATIRLTVSSRANDAKWRFGSVELTAAWGGFPPLHIPVAYRPTQGKVTLASSCERGQVVLGQSVQCRVRAANDGYEDANVIVSNSFDPALHATGTATQAKLLPGIKPGVPNLGDLSDRRFTPLGVKPDAIGDEEMLTYDVPRFTYAGQTFERLGVVSNGYVVVGGGSPQDIQPEPPTEASDARPNNVLAPYWADLDGTGVDGVRVASAKVDGQQWIVVDWHVNHYATTDNVHFQLWLAAGGEEQIRFAYDAGALPSGGAPTIGAENAVGQGVLRVGQPTADVAVTTAGFRPGGTLDYTFAVQGMLPSRDSSFTTSMTSEGVPGTTVVHTRLKVISP